MQIGMNVAYLSKNVVLLMGLLSLAFSYGQPEVFEVLTNLADDPSYCKIVTKIATKFAKTPAQMMWHWSYLVRVMVSHMRMKYSQYTSHLA